MSSKHPDAKDYVSLFQSYDKDLGAIYQEPEDDRYEFLFEQVIRLLVQTSAFNLSLPDAFRRTAHRYHIGDPVTLAHLRDPANRHFMLCDLHDMIMLKGGLALRRKVQS